MVVNVRCYYDTGFNPQNIPYTADILTENFRPKTFPDCFILQNKGLATLRINTSWNEIDGVDYLLIQTDTANVWYFVVGIQMLNENCAELQLVMDALTTCGLNNIEITSGWCIRRHVREDSLFSNIIPEPFTPSNELVLDQGKELKLDGGSPLGDVDIVGATFNLNGLFNAAQEFRSESGNTVIVPKVPSFDKTTYSTIRMIAGAKVFDNRLPNLYLFNLDYVRPQLDQARSLGLDMAITACYRIPQGYAGLTDMTIEGLYKSIANNSSFIDSELPFKYTPNVLNNKVFALFNNYVLASICSGERIEFNADEIFVNGAPSPSFRLWADVSPNGCPYCRPTIYRGNGSDPFMMCVKGMNWQNTPLAFNVKSGAAFDAQIRANRLDYRELEYPAKMLDLSFRTLKGVITGSSGAEAMLFEDKMALEYLKEDTQWEQEQNYRVPEIRFPRDESIQNFIGNTFWVYRTRLSQNDVARFDKFLSMYGYAVDEALTDECFNCRQNFNYVVCRDVNIKVNQSSFIRRMAESQLEGGVRIWHTVPDSSYYTLPNPIVM